MSVLARFYHLDTRTVGADIQRAGETCKPKLRTCQGCPSVYPPQSGWVEGKSRNPRHFPTPCHKNRILYLHQLLYGRGTDPTSKLSQINAQSTIVIPHETPRPQPTYRFVRFFDSHYIEGTLVVQLPSRSFNPQPQNSHKIHPI